MRKINILVLATDYPKPNGYVASYFIHTRNKFYNNNFNVITLNFRAENSYTVDGIKVITLSDYYNLYANKKFDFLISHAPNIRNHYFFVKKNQSNFNKILFFFHGHEVLKHKDSYPEPYEYTKKASIINKFLLMIYDELKLKLWSREFKKLKEKSEFIFVSEWMKEMFYFNTKIKDSDILNKSHIIYNVVGDAFINNTYDKNCKKEYDFITIRNILDNSKYSIDIVNKIAKNNPNYRFCIVGRGNYFKYNTKSNNITLIEKHLSHKEIIEFLNKSKVALMPTRADAQGVMMCEMLTFGIPLVTSNIKVCEEIFKDVENVTFINNNDEKIILDLEKIAINEKIKKCKKFNLENTIYKEIQLIDSLYKMN